MELPLTARKPVEVDVVATLPNGQPATLNGVRFALCDHGGPTAATVWVTGGYASAVGSLTLCGRDATDKSGASTLVLTVARAELWGQPVTAAGTVDPWFIDTIETP